MSLLPTTQARIDRLETWLASQPIGPITRATIVEIATQIAREQDRDTRHACAEAVAALPLLGHRTDPVAIEVKQLAHQACMNAVTV